VGLVTSPAASRLFVLARPPRLILWEYLYRERVCDLNHIEVLKVRRWQGLMFVIERGQK
jgi:hypothetical protein